MRVAARFAAPDCSGGIFRSSRTKAKSLSRLCLDHSLRGHVGVLGGLSRVTENSAAVTADKLGLPEDVALHGSFDLGFGGSRFQIQLRIEGVEFEEIAMRLARRWAWTAVSDFAEIVAALAGAIRKLFLLRDSLGKFLRIRRQVKQHPVHPGAHRRVGIVHDEREALRLCRWFIPGELRRDVRAVAGKFFWDRFPSRKSRTRYLQRHGPPFLLSEELREWQREGAQQKTNQNHNFGAH